ncbi:MAG TPA: hypothetical protein VLY87_06485 [Flavobacterium sp.]|nr:hypothetical protein [Flavobacterium sp.]
MKTLFYLLFALLFLSSCSKNILFGQKEKDIKFKNTGRHISVNVKIDNYDRGNFYFDTGSTWLVIDSSYYKNQKMLFKNLLEDEMDGVGNKQAKSIQILDTINFTIDSHNFYSEFNTIIDLKRILGKNIDGIVGFHNFRGIPFKIDYIKQKISLSPSTLGYEEIKIGFDGFSMFLPMEIELSNKTIITGNFIIDTGSSSTVLTSEFIDHKEIIGSLKTTYINNGGIGGLSQGHSLFIPNINIDKFNLNDKLIDVVSDTLGALSKNENYIGLIGNDILDDFDIIYHPSEYKIWIKL